MKKNSLRSAVAALAVAAVGVTAASMNAFAAPEAASLGFSDEQIAASESKPYVTLTQKVLTLDEVKQNGYKVTVSMSVTDDSSRKYAATGFHVHYDPRLEVAVNDFTQALDITPGPALQYISPSGPVDDPTADEQGMKGFFVCSSGNANNGAGGVMWNANMILPDGTTTDKDGNLIPAAAEGDVYGFDIYYIESKVNEDLFVNTEKDDTGNLMQAWVFTKGIYNELWNPNFAASKEDVEQCAALANIDNTFDGYIAIKDAAPIVTTTTTEAPVVVETTTTTVAPDVVVTSTASTKPAVTTAKPATTKAPTTTKPSGNSPKTGVAGVGVAAAGLAVALGTAFVLRKKED